MESIARDGGSIGGSASVDGLPLPDGRKGVHVHATHRQLSLVCVYHWP